VRIRSFRFVASAYRPLDEPREAGPEIAFLGRSNVGKSSLINRLLDTRGLARTSSQPGRTQSVNFYRVNDRFYFVDLPGYGYARVPETVRRAWKPLVDGYLERHRERVALGLLVVDARREPTELDGMMIDWLAERSIGFVVAATKADKLSGNERAKAKARLTAAWGAAAAAPPVLVSSRDGRGMKELWGHLDRVLAPGATDAATDSTGAARADGGTE